MKYVIANIKVPIGFNDDQSIKTFMERISIDFVSCTELPPIPPENEFKNDKFLKNLKEFFQKSTNLPDSVEQEPESDEPEQDSDSESEEPEQEFEEPEEPEPKEQPKCSPHYVSKNELLLKPSKYTHNSSFKNKIKNNNSHHYTFKNKSSLI